MGLGHPGSSLMLLIYQETTAATFVQVHVHIVNNWTKSGFHNVQGCIIDKYVYI